MPSIVLFGKHFCENFVLAKFPWDFQGFRPAGTQLLFSDPGRLRPPSLFCRRPNRVLTGPNQGRRRQNGSVLGRLGRSRARQSASVPGDPWRPSAAPARRGAPTPGKPSAGKAAAVTFAPALREVVCEPISEGLTHQGELCPTRQAREIAPFTACEVSRAIATEHGHWLPNAVEPHRLGAPSIVT